MNQYGITINNHSEQIEAASMAHTAVDRAMARYVEGEFKPCATIKVRFIGKVTYTWDIIADVPFDYKENGQGYSRKVVGLDFPTEKDADIEMQTLSTTHSDWKHIRLARRIKK